MFKDQIIDLRDPIDRMYAACYVPVRNFIQRHCPDASVTAIDNHFLISHARRFCLCVIQDELDSTAKWKKEDEKTDLLAEHIYTLYIGILQAELNISVDSIREAVIRRSADELLQIIDPIVTDIIEIVSEITHNDEWWIWTLRVGNDYVVLQSEEDWRVRIFNQKIASGEWKL